MIGFVSRALSSLGLDRAVSASLAGKLWTGAANAVTVMLISRLLSPTEQGYYYTFSSLIALQVFIELGMNVVITQMAAHNVCGRTLSSRAEMSRLGSLLRIAAAWYGLGAFLLILGLIPGGIVFFSKQQSCPPVTWQLPWVLGVLATAVLLFLSPFLAALEGCGLVVSIAVCRLNQTVVGCVALWTALWFDFRLMALPVYIAVQGVIGIAFIAWKHSHFIFDALRAYRPDAAIDWRREMLPFQWRIALSWMSGYFSFQFFTPALFHWRGPIPAGQMGMALSMMNMLSACSLVWVSTKVPYFGASVARRDWPALDALFRRAFAMSIGAALAAAGATVAATLVVYHLGLALASRIPPPLPMAFLSVATVANVAITAQAFYLRSFRREPFLFLSILTSALTAIGVYVTARYGDLTTMTAVYLSITVGVGLVLGTRTFLKARRAWCAPLDSPNARASLAGREPCCQP